MVSEESAVLQSAVCDPSFRDDQRTTNKPSIVAAFGRFPVKNVFALSVAAGKFCGRYPSTLHRPKKSTNFSGSDAPSRKVKRLSKPGSPGDIFNSGMCPTHWTRALTSLPFSAHSQGVRVFCKLVVRPNASAQFHFLAHYAFLNANLMKDHMVDMVPVFREFSRNFASDFQFQFPHCLRSRYLVILETVVLIQKTLLGVILTP